MKTTKIRQYIIFVLCILVLIFLIINACGNGDFKIFLEASKLIAAGKNPYHLWIFLSEGNYAYYFNSPLWAIILIPFNYLPPFVTNFVWLSANATLSVVSNCAFRDSGLLTAYYSNFSTRKQRKR